MNAPGDLPSSATASPDLVCTADAAPPRVVFLNRFFHPDLSATSQMLSDLAFGLAERGFEVEVITSRLRYDDRSARLPARETIRGVKVHRIWTSGFGRRNLWGRGVDYLSFYLSALRACYRTLRPGDTLVAKTDPPMISVVGAIACKLRGAALVNWLQDLFPEIAAAAGIRMGRGRVGAVLQKIRNASLHAAQMNVAIGHKMRERLISEGMSTEQTLVIENWADAAIHPVPRDQNPLRMEWGLEGKFVVGYSGNMGVAHDFNTMLGAAELLINDDRIHFLIIGNGKHRASVEQMIQSRNLNNVSLKPYQARDSLSESLSVPDIHIVSLLPEFEGLIVPSKYYGICAVGRETILIGASDGELAQHIDTEAVVPAGNAERLAALIVSRASAATLAGPELLRASPIDPRQQEHALGRWEDALAMVAIRAQSREPRFAQDR